MSRKNFAEHESLNSKPMSLLKIFITVHIIAYLIGLGSSMVSTIFIIGMYIVLLLLVDHHLMNNYENIEILALQIEKLQAQQENIRSSLTKS